MAFSRGQIVPTYDPVSGQITRVDAPGDVTFDIGRAGPYVTSLSWRRRPGGSTAESALPRGAVVFGYDTAGRLNVVGTRSFGATTNAVTATYGYDDDGLLTSIATSGGPTMSLVPTPTTGLLESMSVGGVSTTVTPNAFGELQTLTTTHTDTTTSSTRTYGNAYTYDDAGRIRTRTETVDGVATVFAYGYDAAGRLQEVERGGVVVEAYEYDDNGNRESSTLDGVTTTATYDEQDRLLTYGTRSYTYNAHGQLATMTDGGQSTTYRYDEFDNLIHVDLPDGTDIDYLIDGANRRVGRKVNGVFERGWLYRDQLEPVAEVDSTGAITATFIYGSMPHVPDMVVRGAETYRVVTDHLGSVRRLIRLSDGAVVQSFEYDAWGNVRTVGLDSDLSLQPFRFAGGLYDANTGLTRFGARDYDPECGRWTSKDPIRFSAGSANIYEYAGSNPVRFIDASGLSIRQAWIAAGRYIRRGRVLERFSQAFGIMRRGNGVVATTASEARDFAKAYSVSCGGNGDVVHDVGHVIKGGNGGRGLNHYHALDAAGERLAGHAWYERIGAFFAGPLDAITDSNGDGVISDGEAMELFCPLPWGCGLDEGSLVGSPGSDNGA